MLGVSSRRGMSKPVSTSARVLRVLFIVALAMFALPIWQGSVPVASANTLTVSSCDSATFNSVFSSAGDGDVIQFACDGTIPVSQALTVNRNLTIDGNGHTVTLDGGNASRIFIVTTAGGNASAAITFTIKGVTLAHASGTRGGAIFVPGAGAGAGSYPANLVVDHDTFSSNAAGNSGGALDSDNGNLTVSNSTFSGNSAGGNDGAIGINQPPGGGSTTLTGDTFTGNTAPEGGAIGLGTNSPTYILNSTFTGNSATGTPAGGNTPGGSAIVSYAQTTIIGSTIAGNSGGAQLELDASSGTFKLKGSILSRTDGGANCGVVSSGVNANFADGGYNDYFGDATNCSALSASATSKSGDPLLGALLNNGGPTQTMKLGAGSTAIALWQDCQDNSSAQITTDQRGYSRPQNGCDSGAYQTQPNLVTNGSFESPQYPTGTWGPSADGWSVCSGPSMEIQNAILGAAADGVQYAELNSTAPSAYCQTLSTTPGQSYQFSFWFAPRPGTGTDANQMDVTWGSNDLTPNRIIGDGTGVTVAKWHRYSFTVTATTASTTIKFADVGDTQGLGDLLDNVQVVAASSVTLNTNPPVFGAVEVLGTDSSWTVDGTATNATVETSLCDPSYVNPSVLPGAQWIWTNNCTYDNGSTHTFTKHFNVSQQPGYATLQIAVDNSAVVTINGNTVVNDASQNTPQLFRELRTYDVTSALKGGDNVISIQDTNDASSGPTPAGVLARLTFQDGSYSTGTNGVPYYTIYGTSAAPLGLTGNGDPGASVSVFSGSCSGTQVGTATVDASGDWATSITTLTEGSVSLYARESVQNVPSTCAGPLKLVVDRTAPTSSMSFPTAVVKAGDWATGCANSPVLPTQAGICGTASDSGSGVAIVLVAIENSSSHYYNGTDFSSTSPVWVRATLGTPSGGTVPFKLPIAQLPDDHYTIASGAIDYTGNLSTFLAQNVCDVPDAVANGCVNLSGGGSSFNGGGSSLNGGGSSFNGGGSSLNGGGSSLNGGGSSLNGGGSSFNGGGSSFNGGGSSFNGGGSSFNGGGSSFNGGGSSLNGGGSSFNGGGSSFNGGGSSFNGGGSSLNGGGSSFNGGGSSFNGGGSSLNGGVGTSSEHGNIVVDTVAPTASISIDGQTQDGAVSVNPNSTLRIQFGENMACGSISNITVTPAAGPPTVGTTDQTCTGVTIGGLSPSTFYTVNVSGATDVAGNGSSTPNFHFTTAAFDPSQVASLDTDGDGIPDALDGTTAVTFTLKNPDTGQPINKPGTGNPWTTTTKDMGFTSPASPPPPGTVPTTRDLCVVENYMQGAASDGFNGSTAISQQANQLVVDAFARHHIHLVIFEGDGSGGAGNSAGLPSGYTGPYFGGPVPMVDPLGNTDAINFSWTGTDTASDGHTTPQLSYEQIKDKYFGSTGLAQFCHYVVVAHRLGGTDSTGSSRGIDGSDIVLALAAADSHVGTTLQQAGSLMHELGHNLGLHHGGAVSPTSTSPLPGDINLNYKPNYLSVMNYSYQFSGVLLNTPTTGSQTCQVTTTGSSTPVNENCLLDYSEGTLQPIDEGNLNETQGLQPLSSTSWPSTLPLANYSMKHRCVDSSGVDGYSSSVVFNATGPVDWNCSGVLDPYLTSTPETYFVNGDTSGLTVLNGYDDWDNLNFLVGTIGLGAHGTSTSISQPPLQPTSDVDIVAGEPGGTDSIAKVAVPQANAVITTAGINNVLAFPSPVTITYGTALSATSLGDTSPTSLPGMFTYQPTSLGPGQNQPVTATFTPNDQTDYKPTTQPITVNVLYKGTGTTCDGDAGHQILQPVNPPGSTTSVFKQGSVVPLKFRVCDVNGQSVGPTTPAPSVVTTFGITKTVAGSGSVNETTVSATPDTSFRWDSTNQQWIFNLSTKSLTAGTTYTYTINLNDGTSIPVTFGLR